MSKSRSTLKLEEYADYLLSLALRKCDSIEDAQDLTQETLLAALVYWKNGNKIEDIQAWLTSVINRKYYDLLRRKYRRPTVTIGDNFDLLDPTPGIAELISKTEEYNAVRREIAYLSKLYRSIFTRHYFYGESLTKIAKDTGIPVDLSTLAKAIGIPTAYIEGTVDKLVKGELMRQLSDGKVYTDFVIYEPDDWLRYLKDQEQFAHDYAPKFNEPLAEAISQLKTSGFYSRSLERFMTIHIADHVLYKALQSHIRPQIFPERPNGGKWIAFGSLFPENYSIPPDKCGKEEYNYSGERITRIDNYLDARDLKMLNYETSLYPISKYDGFDYPSFTELELDLLKLFYLIHKNISPETVGFNPKMLTAIPLLVEKGMLKVKERGTELLIPYLTNTQFQQFLDICDQAILKGASNLEEPLGDFIKTRKKEIPAHLDSVPDQKLIMPHQPNAMMLVYEAINHGVIPRDLGYICPETIVVFD